jgi:uncharacterized protein
MVVWPEGHAAWAVTTALDIVADELIAALSEAQTIEVLLIGCGPEFGPEPAGLRAALREAGYVLEWMDTGAACRTFNVLVGEDRRVAAALIAV